MRNDVDCGLCSKSSTNKEVFTYFFSTKSQKQMSVERIHPKKLKKHIRITRTKQIIAYIRSQSTGVRYHTHHK